MLSLGGAVSGNDSALGHSKDTGSYTPQALSDGRMAPARRLHEWRFFVIRRKPQLKHRQSTPPVHEIRKLKVAVVAHPLDDFGVAGKSLLHLPLGERN